MKVLLITYLSAILLESQKVDCTFQDWFSQMFPSGLTGGLGQNERVTSLPPTTTAKEDIFDNDKFKIQTFTESYPYPTIPSGEKEFRKWEEEQEKQYAKEILAKLSSPNDTRLEFEAKSLIANFVVNAVIDNATLTASKNKKSNGDADLHLIIEDDVITHQSGSWSSFGSNEEASLGQQFEQDQTQQFQQNPNLQGQNLQNIQNQNLQNLQQSQPVNYFPDLSEPDYPPKPTTRGPLGLPFNPIDSIRNALISSTGNDTKALAVSPLNPVLNLLGGARKTTPPPDGSTTEDELYLVPVKPSTEKNTISSQQKDLLNQVERLRDNVGKRNISGVLDETLRIASLQTVGVFVTGFLDLLLCNPIDRWNGRCEESE